MYLSGYSQISPVETAAAVVAAVVFALIAANVHVILKVNGNVTSTMARARIYSFTPREEFSHCLSPPWEMWWGAAPNTL